MNGQPDTIIIGAGISGLTVAHKLNLKHPERDLLILEKGSRAGGCIESHHEQHYIAEIGPHGFLDNCQESRDLLQETGLDQESVKAPLIDFVRYVFLNNKLNTIEQTPMKIIMAPLIPWKDKIGVLRDLYKKPLEGEPTVAKWVDHRFGPALLPYVDAVFTGTYAGDINKLKIDAVMPGVRALEKTHGGLIRGLIAKMWKNRKNGKKILSMPAMTSFANGMHRLPEKLASGFLDSGRLKLNTNVTSISQDEETWIVTTETGEEYRCNNLVLAVSTNISLKLLSNVDKTMPLEKIPEAKIVSVIFGYDNGATLPPGFGFLTPEVEKRFTLGTLFSSNMFPGRAPQGHIVFEVLIGGRRHPERVNMSSDDLIKYALKDVKDILKLPGEPAYTRVLRSGWGIPQLEEKYPALLAWKEELVSRKKGLQVCGFGWEGIGLNDMIKSATRVAENIEAGSTSNHEAEIKKVYF